MEGALRHALITPTDVRERLRRKGDIVAAVIGNEELNVALIRSRNTARIWSCLPAAAAPVGRTGKVL